MKTNPKTKLRKDISSNRRIDTLYKNISGYIHTARQNIVRTVDNEMVQAYWLTGRDIVEEEQKGQKRAGYGTYLLQEISGRLSREFGNGFGLATVKDMRRFYSVYEIRHAVRGESMPAFKANLSWIHYRALMRESRDAVRSFYEIEASKNNWSGRELERQMGSLLFERLLKSRDKKGLMRLACKGQELVKPEDAIKDPVILEFLNLPESHKLIESKLEDALISNMQNFLLELGRGFAFVARQKRLTLDGKYFYCDLVFYNYVLKNFILIDIKTKELSHADLGQMQLYVNYFDMEIKAENDNPTVGLILCTKQSKKMVKYFLGDRAKQIFASKYQFELPTEKELEDELKREIKHIKYKLEHKNK